MATGVAIESRKPTLRKSTPAEKKANSGTQTPALSGWMRCESRSAGDSASPGSVRTRVRNPKTTPAIVAWIPLSCVKYQPARTRGTYRNGVVMRRRCAKAYAAKVARAAPNQTREKWSE